FSDDGKTLDREYYPVVAAAGVERARRDERWPKFDFVPRKLKLFWQVLLSPGPRRECVLYIKKEWGQLSEMAQGDYISRGTHEDRILDGTAYQSSSDPYRDVAKVCDEELAHIEATHNRGILSKSLAQIADSPTVPSLVFEEVWHRKDGWKGQLNRVDDKLLELKLLRDRVWIGTRAELGFFIRDAKAKNLIAGRYQCKRIFEAGLSIEEPNEQGKLVVNALSADEITSAHDTARDDNPAYKRTRTPESIELQSFLQFLPSVK